LFNQAVDDCKILRIGIYGNTRAGKTRYIHKLIHYWQNKNLIRSLSNEAYDFMRSVDDQIKNADQVSPTKGITENISIDVLQDSKSAIKTKYIFSDLLGEMLAEEVDTTETNDNPISQILKCNAYLFFFNPTGIDQNVDLDEHFFTEKERALKLIAHIHQHRENDYLPIVFVVTHLDKLKIDSDLFKKATEWLNEIADGYSKDLELHYKQVISISNEAFKQANFKTMISSLSEENIEIPVRNINLMIRKIKGPKHWGLLLFVGLFFIFFPTVIIALILFPNGCVSVPGKLDDAKALGAIKIFEEMLKDISDKNKSIEEKLKVVEKINNEITTWMVPNINAINSGLKPKTIDNINKSIEKSHKAITDLIDFTSDRKSKCDILAKYISKFLSYNSLTEPEKNLADLYWKNYEEYILEEGSSIINRYRVEGATVSKCREEVGSHFKKIENEFSLSKITGGDGKKTLGEQLKITFQFLSIKPQFYNCKFEVLSAKLIGSNPPEEIGLRVKYIDSKDYSILLNRNDLPKDGLKTKEKEYLIQFQMIPEPPVIEVEFYDESIKNWKKYETLNLLTLEDVKKAPFGPLGIVFPFKGKDWECTIDVPGKNIKIEGKFFLDLKNIPNFVMKMGENDNGYNKK